MSDYKTIVLSTGIFRNSEKRILLLQRSKKNSSFKNYWQLPEGKLEYGEQPEQALKREVKEETSLKIDKCLLKGVYSAKTRIGKKAYFLVRAAFECRAKGKIVLSKDHKEAAWVVLKDAIKYKKVIPGTRELLKTLY